MEYETSNPNDYKKCLNLVNHLDGVNDIFPKDVPSDAMDIVWIIAFVVSIMRYRSNKDK